MLSTSNDFLYCLKIYIKFLSSLKGLEETFAILVEGFIFKDYYICAFLTPIGLESKLYLVWP